jgi:hypothetical protein
MKKKSEEENKKDNTGWNAFLELRRQAQHNMQQPTPIDKKSTKSVFGGSF